MKASIVQGDAASVLKTIVENSIDLTVTSPPYDNLRTYNGYSFDFETIASELYRVTKDGGVVVWIVGDSTINGSETGTSFRQALYFKDVCGFNLHDTMIWEKPHFANPSSNRCHQVFEYMFIFSKGKPKTFNQILDVPIKYGKPVGKSSQRHTDGSITNTETSRQSLGQFGARRNVWKINTSGQEQFGKKQEHPATFSEQLARDHILSWSNENDLILDPFLGSGTTGKMALELNRYFIGIEISAEYIKLATQRLDNVANNTDT